MAVEFSKLIVSAVASDGLTIATMSRIDRTGFMASSHTMKPSMVKASPG
jgi:hypothetical protein